MRRVEIEPNLHLTFAGRDEQFDQGIEVGAAVALMAQGIAAFDRSLSTGALEQLRPLAEGLGYLIIATATDAVGASMVHVVRRGQRPRLRLVG